MQENTSKKLFDILISKGLDPKTLDSSGKSIVQIDNATIFSFDFKSSHTNYGTVVILLSDDDEFNIYYGDNIGKGMNRTAKNTWYELLTQLRYFAKRNLLSFSLKNISKLKHSMQGMAAIKEGLYEGWNGTSKTSYNPQKNKTRIIAKHSKKIKEGDARFRNIKDLFIENSNGERFKLPFSNIAGARAMARHVSEGGNPYDVFGLHITETVKDINAIGRFLRVKSLNETSSQLIEGCKTHYQKLRENLKNINLVRGYKAYKESWSPAIISNDEELVETIRNLLIPEGTDSRVDDAIPALSRFVKANEDVINFSNSDDLETQYLSKGEESNMEMKELKVFENWAQTISEGTWALPDSTNAVTELKQLLSTEMPVGVDALNATEALYNLIGDDVLFDSLSTLAESDPTADARPLIVGWLREFSYKFDGMNDVLNALDLGIEQ